LQVGLVQATIWHLAFIVVDKMRDFISTCMQEPVRYARNPLFSNLISGNASPCLCTHQYGMQGSCCSLLLLRHFFSIYAHVAVWHTRKLYFRYWKYITSSPYMAVQYARN